MSMRLHDLVLRVAMLLAIITLGPVSVLAAKAPSVEQALSLAPIQSDVDYAVPSAGEAKQCSVKPEKVGKVTAWVVRSPDDQVLRRFSDTNSDNYVDLWSYYKDGVEVYRDIDANFNKKPDQCRWFHTGGTRWGYDKNEDGRIDSWRTISPHEVAEELVNAIRNRDEQAFGRLLLTPEELNRLGLGATLLGEFQEKITGAPSRFRQLIRGQNQITKTTRFVDFGSARPGTVPAGADGATRDVVVHEGASALLDNDGKTEQLQLGILVEVGDGWRLIDAPQVGSEGVELSSVFALSRFASGRSDTGAPPSEQMTKLMEQLQQLDERIAKAKPADRTKMIETRADMLRKLASVTDDASLKDQWYGQLADMLSAAVVEGSYPKGVEELEQLAKDLQRQKASKEALAHVEFQSIWADWGRRSQDPKQDYAKVQDAWLKQLKAFAGRYPSSPDTAEALLQLGMADEFAGQTEQAEKWYTQLARNFSSNSRGRKAAGALRRLDSIGKRISISGDAIGGGRISLEDYRGKYTLVQYWATWCEPCKSDMAQIKALNAKYGSRGFAVLGVNLDQSVSRPQEYLQENRLPWKHIYDEGGLDGKLAGELGVMTLPLMILVDDEGKVLHRNIHVAELDAELKRVIRK